MILHFPTPVLSKLRIELPTHSRGSIACIRRVPPRPCLRSVVLHCSLKVDGPLLKERCDSLLVIFTAKHLIDQLAVQQMSALGAVWVPVHHLLAKMDGYSTAVLHDFVCKLEGTRENSVGCGE